MLESFWMWVEHFVIYIILVAFKVLSYFYDTVDLWMQQQHAIKEI